MNKIFLFLLIQILTNQITGSVNSDFPEFAYMNLSVDPCENFYEFTCGNFKNLFPLGENELLIDQFTILEQKLTDIAEEILSADDLPNDSFAIKKAKAAYSACMSEHFIDNLYMRSPEIEIINQFGGFPIIELPTQLNDTSFGWYEIADIAAEFGINIFFSVSPYYDTANATGMSLMILNETSTIDSQIRPTYQATYDEVIEKAFYKFATKSKKPVNLKGVKDTDQFDLLLKKILLKLNRDLGHFHDEQYISEQVAKISEFMNGIYNGGYVPDNVTIDQFNSSLPLTLGTINNWIIEHFGDSVKIDWIKYIQRLFKYTYAEIDENIKVVAVDNLATNLYGILNWVRINDPDIIKSTALLRAFVYMASDSDKETQNYFNEYLLSIGSVVYPRWQYCTRKIMDLSGSLSLSYALIHTYRKKFFQEEKIKNATEMINNLQTSFKTIIEETDWMEDESKEAAYKKVDYMITLLGYPEFTDDLKLLDQFYENLPISKWDHYSNSKVLRALKQTYLMNMLSERNRKVWEISTFVTNAYYNKQNNRIIFPVAMLNPIFYNGSHSILDYSRIGMVIAHEITHGFDSQGCLFDENGTVQIWWTTPTILNYSNKSKCFIEQYSKYPIPEINSTTDGVATLNENIADNGGTRNAFKAFQRYANEQKIPQYSSQFTNEQMFFISFGTMWCNNESNKYLESLQSETCVSKSMCHSRAKLRVNGVVSNMEDFAAAFSCPKGSAMNPDKKCKLW